MFKWTWRWRQLYFSLATKTVSLWELFAVYASRINQSKAWCKWNAAWIRCCFQWFWFNCWLVSIFLRNNSLSFKSGFHWLVRRSDIEFQNALLAGSSMDSNLSAAEQTLDPMYSLNLSPMKTPSIGYRQGNELILNCFAGQKCSVLVRFQNKLI